MNILEVKNLVKYFGTAPHLVKAVDDVSFTIEQGEFAAIIGKSGSGKTTLLHLIGALEIPTSGMVRINDTVICAPENDDEKISPALSDERTIFRRQNIGFIFQSYNLLPFLNVQNNILLPLGLDRKEADFDFYNEIIDMLCLKDKLRQYHFERRVWQNRGGASF